MRFTLLLATSVVLSGASTAFAQNATDISLCDVVREPKSFDGKVIRLRGTLRASFEDFTLKTDQCYSQKERAAGVEQGVWLSFGGDVPGIVASTVNDNFRKFGSDLTVDGITYGIKKDDDFYKIYALLAARHNGEAMYRVSATITGTFLAGAKRKLADGRSDFGGYGHLGCCSLLVITQVSNVDSVPTAALDVNGVVTGPGGEPLHGVTVLDDVLGGSPPVRQDAITDELGRFHFKNSGQLLRIENPAYRPVALQIVPGDAPIRVQLENATKSDWILRECGSGPQNSQRLGFTVRYEIPVTMTSSESDHGGAHSYFVYRRGLEPVDADFFISTGAEQSWEPSDEVIESRWSRQRWIRDGKGKVIGIDAAGRWRKGGRWRTASFFDREWVTYDLRPGKSAHAMDVIVNSACLAQTSEQIP